MKRIRMIRTFHNIGQGAFYTERFQNYTMVYDCGGSKAKIIEKEIRHTFEKNEEIHALFISHFHADHINGLEYLLTYCNVKTVYLPLVHDNEKIQLLIENSYFGGDNQFVRELIQNPEQVIKSFNDDTEVIFVKANQQDLDRRSEPDEKRKVIDSGTHIPVYEADFEQCRWVYIPYNFQYSVISKKLVHELNMIGITSSNFLNLYISKKTEIIKIYETVLGGTNNFNTNSLVVYSGIDVSYDDNCNCWFEYYINYCSHSFDRRYKVRHWKEACLYMGDYNAKDPHQFDELRNAFDKYWDRIGTIQVPHHGSNHNFNSGLIENANFAVISAGKKNRFGHPHTSTLHKILNTPCIPIVVTEDPYTRFMENIRIWKRN